MDYRYLIYQHKKQHKDDIPYTNGALGQRGHITKLTEKQLEGRGIIFFVAVPYWVRKQYDL